MRQHAEIINSQPLEVERTLQLVQSTAQWGAWRPAEAADAAHRRAPVALDGPVDGDHAGAAAMVRVGKTAAGRLLDWRMWDEFPRSRAKAGVGGG
jgi:hypothetical protein